MKVEEVIKILGFKDKKDFEAKTNMALHKHWSGKSFTLHYIDPFQVSVLSGNVIIGVHNKTDVEIITEFKKKIKYKRSKIPKIENMRLILHKEIHEKLALWFNIDPELIKNTDFIFKNHAQFFIAGAQFSFSATFSSNSIILSEYIYTYEKSAERMSTLYKYYYGQSLREIIDNLKT